MRYQERTLSGKAYLETDFLLFRGDERLKVLFKDLRSVKASSGVLHLDFPGGPAELELGKAAEKWSEKILNPPSRLDKLGVKPGLSVRLVGDFEPDFIAELEQRQIEPAKSSGNVDLLFYAARKTSDLKKVKSLATGMHSDGALWVVYPKGVAEIREIEVLESGRDCGLKDVKVASFSKTHTALKFVVPVGKR